MVDIYKTNTYIYKQIYKQIQAKMQAHINCLEHESYGCETKCVTQNHSWHVVNYCKTSTIKLSWNSFKAIQIKL